MELEKLQIKVQEIIAETSGAGFYITTNANEWTLIIQKGCTIFKGKLEEVFQLYINEILEYRFLKENKKANKKFTYQ